MPILASDQWNGWRLLGTTLASVDANGFLTTTSAAGASSRAAWAVPVVGGDTIEFDVEAEVTAGKAYVWAQYASTAGPVSAGSRLADLNLVPNDLPGLLPIDTFRVQVPTNRAPGVVYILVGTYDNDLVGGTARWFRPIVRSTHTHLAPFAWTGFEPNPTNTALRLRLAGELLSGEMTSLPQGDRITSGSASALLDTSGRLLVGTATAQFDSSTNARVINAYGSGTLLGRVASGGGCHTLASVVSRGAVPGDNATVLTGDDLFELRVCAADGTNQVRSSNIVWTAEGTVGTGIVPSRIGFRLMNAAGAFVETMRLDSKGNVSIGPANTVLTTDTDGFLNMPRMNGTPTGTPTIMSNKIPMVWDYAANKLWAYSGGAWVAPAAAPSATLVNGSNTATWDSSGRLLIGTASAIADDTSAFRQFQAHRAGAMGMLLGQWAGGGPRITTASSQGGAVGTRGVSLNNDLLGEWVFDADNGTAFVSAARIRAFMDGSQVSSIPRAKIQLSVADAAGAQQVAVDIDKNRNVQMGAGAPATTATDGYPYVPVVAGTPTGVPTAKTGFAAMVVDSTGSKVWFYVGGAWKSAALI